MSLQVSVVKNDVLSTPADVLLLKYAQSFHGADQAVALRLMQQSHCQSAELTPTIGDHRLVPTHGALEAAQVLMLGTPTLSDFRYKEMRQFARLAIKILEQQRVPVQTLATTVHGAGYGLDIEEALQSMLLGFQQGLTTHPLPRLQRIVFVERNARRYEVLRRALSDIELVLPTIRDGAASAVNSDQLQPERKKSVFVAMPFTEDFEDMYQFGIYATMRRLGYVCERVDESAFTGNIVERITDGIKNAEFVIADLSLERPNVYLEVGFAWGLKKPVILVAREGQRLHFDLSHHKCLFYRTIGKLSESLEVMIRRLYGRGSHQEDDRD
ncbi:MAG TPA: hypothetical protein VL096_08230 [Pirellulaceae bacterium]|nr:hypothetical protein [Pirellulaceae bacterium]